MNGADGSSPLARGLLHEFGHEEIEARIIPARAGFTIITGGRRGAPADHPRSRGVYDETFVAMKGLAGSSPLARGLRSARSARPSNPGIIPARAGFTPSVSSIMINFGDHPRSRGVYPVGDSIMAAVPGSSPLARGLLIRMTHITLRWGIIPARAGFTVIRGGSVYDVKDHPRSRGVYRRGRRKRPWSGGSSPLARGLPFSETLNTP